MMGVLVGVCCGLVCVWIMLLVRRLWRALGDPRAICPTCLGSGWLGIGIHRMTCHQCGGCGRLPEEMDLRQ